MFVTVQNAEDEDNDCENDDTDNEDDECDNGDPDNDETTNGKMATVFLPAFLMNSVKSACCKSATMPRYRGSSGIASATAALLAPPIGDENRQRPLPRMPDTRVPSTRLPLPRIQETPLPCIYLFRCFCRGPAPLLRCCFLEDRRFEPNPFTEMRPFTV